MLDFRGEEEGARRVPINYYFGRVLCSTFPTPNPRRTRPVFGTIRCCVLHMLSRFRGAFVSVDKYNTINPRLTGEGYFGLPLVFARYLRKLQTDHRQIFSTLPTQPTIFWHILAKEKLASSDASAVKDVTVTPCLPGFR